MATLSTGDVSKRLGFLVTAAFIESLGVQPVELIKSHPRWSEDNFKSICAGIADHVYQVAQGTKKAPATKAVPKPKAVPVKASSVDDDDEL